MITAKEYRNYIKSKDYMNKLSSEGYYSNVCYRCKQAIKKQDDCYNIAHMFPDLANSVHYYAEFLFHKECFTYMAGSEFTTDMNLEQIKKIKEEVL